MPVCPVCENAQAAGEACDVCGRPLAPAFDAPGPVSPVDGLETTRHAPALELSGEVLPDLEPTLQAAVGAAPPADAFDGLEATRLPSGPDLPPEAIDIEATRLPPVPDDEAPRLRICRYCRTPVTGSERFCAGCGTRLPRERARVTAAAEPVRPICSGCGLPLVGTRCAGCGTRAARS